MRRLTPILLFFFIPFIAKGQEVHFSQFYASPLFLSPSYAGTSDGFRLAANYRDQWPGIKDAFTSYSFGLDYNLAALRSGIGLLAWRDTKGELGYNTTNLGLIYSYDVYAFKHLHFRPGLQLNYITSGIDYSKLRLREQLVLGSSASYSRPDFAPFNYLDMAVSGLAYTQKLWTGFKIDHLLRPGQVLNGQERLPLEINVFGGYEFTLHNKSVKESDEHLMAAFNFMTTARFMQLEAGALYMNKGVQIGGWYRGLPFTNNNQRNDAVILSIGYVFNNVNLGYSHDFTISGLSTSSNGANEISMVLLFDNPLKNSKKRKALKCPTFNFRRAGK